MNENNKQELFYKLLDLNENYNDIFDETLIEYIKCYLDLEIVIDELNK